MDTSTKNQTLVYRFVDVDPEEGLDAKDLSKFLSQFDGLIKEVAKESGTLEKTTIKVRPFKEGSFITEFVIHCVPGLIDALNSDAISAINNAGGLVEVLFAISHIIKKLKDISLNISQLTMELSYMERVRTQSLFLLRSTR